VPKPLDLTEYAKAQEERHGSENNLAAAPANPMSSQSNGLEEEGTMTLYIRVPTSLGLKLRDRAADLSRGKRKKTSQTDLVVQALRMYLEN
jgi:hypothetical protein